MREVNYLGKDGKHYTIKYDENKPCIICGEPVISASMGGTVICPLCDCGRCRYCGMTIYCLREEVDGGCSKKVILNHMKWHHENTPEIVAKINDAHRKFNEAWDKVHKNESNLDSGGKVPTLKPDSDYIKKKFSRPEALKEEKEKWGEPKPDGVKCEKCGGRHER